MEGEARLSIVSAGILYGLVTVGGNLLGREGFGVLDISFFFIFFSILVLAPFAFRKNHAILSVMKKNWRFLSLYAIVNLFILLSQFSSLALGLSPPIVALLLYTQPIWTIMFSRMAFKEIITLRKIAIIGLAIVGILLVTNPFSLLIHSQAAFSNSHLALSSNLIFAELLALIGGLFLSLWVILGKKGRMTRIKEPVSLTFAVRTFSLFPIGIASSVAYLLSRGLFFGDPSDYSLIGLSYLALFAIFAGALPDYLFYRGVNKVPATQAGMILLMEPISATILSAILKISVLTWLQLLGGGLILFANYFVIIEEGRIRFHKDDKTEII